MWVSMCGFDDSMMWIIYHYLWILRILPGRAQKEPAPCRAATSPPEGGNLRKLYPLWDRGSCCHDLDVRTERRRGKTVRFRRVEEDFQAH